MKTKDIVGTLIIGIGIGGMCYLFFGYIKPRIDFNKEQSKLQ